MEREDEIRLIAYSIWEQEGCPHGRDSEHWFRAISIWEEKQTPKAEAAVARAISPTAGEQGSKAISTRKKSRKT